MKEPRNFPVELRFHEGRRLKSVIVPMWKAQLSAMFWNNGPGRHIAIGPKAVEIFAIDPLLIDEADHCARQSFPGDYKKPEGI